MEFRIADSFTESLARLNAEEQKAAKIAAFDLQANPAHPSLQFHKLEKSRDKNFWSIRVSSDLRLIVHRTASSLLLCYVAHHDQAYQWAERRKIETHPKTGAAQLVEIREVTRHIPALREVAYRVPIGVGATRTMLFEQIPDSELLGYGVPPDWLDTVRRIDSEEAVLDVASHLPAEAAEALLNLAAGTPATPSTRVVSATPPVGTLGFLTVPDPFVHPDAQRRFRTIKSEEELRQALDYPWEKWSIFLHPAQRQIVERRFNGPARVSGSAGTGKTIVALHRSVYLARENPSSRVLLTTFSDVLANALRQKLRLLLASEPRLAEQIEVEGIDAIGTRLYERIFGAPKLADRTTIQSLLNQAVASSPNNKFSSRFLESEWDRVVDAWQLKSWGAYRDVSRLGRRTRLPEAARQHLWTIFAEMLHKLASAGMVTTSQIFTTLATHFQQGNRAPFDFAVVDEAQDIGVAQLKFLAAIGNNRPDSLFFSGDLGQRIFQQPFSWKSLGVDIRGRSGTLRVNYRTSHQIRRQADRLLGPEVSDVDGHSESRKTISLFDGVPPEIAVCDTESAEIARVADWLKARIVDGAKPSEIAIFVRSAAQLQRAQAATASAGLPAKLLDPKIMPPEGALSLGTMHEAKGLEFRAVAVMACDDEVVPLQERIEEVSDETDLEEVYNTERHLLYVACTRARDHLLVSGTAPASEFLDDLRNAERGSNASQYTK